MYEKDLENLNIDFILKLFGTLDVNVLKLEKELDVKIINRVDSIRIQGQNQENIDMAVSAIRQLQKLTAMNESIDENLLNYVISMVKEQRGDELSTIYDNCILLSSKGAPIKAKTVGQQRYVDSIRSNTIVFGIGPAGTGKTFLAVAMAVSALKAKEVSRIVLTRPAVEAGEKLGFLPGDLQSKIDPYLRPLYDALGEMLGRESFARFLEKGTIEIAPLAYMRGRTLDDAFIILDEAQNTTPEQMKMFLTRLGNNSKAIVTGDLTQIDLPFIKKSGLIEAVEILNGIEGISIFRFSHKDVVRHPLVQKIILAYEANKGKIKHDEKHTQTFRRTTHD